MKMVRLENRVHEQLKAYANGRTMSEAISRLLDGRGDPVDRILDQMKLLHERLDKLDA